jgi:Kef-type K+ transport system membrane component KefB
MYACIMCASVTGMALVLFFSGLSADMGIFLTYFHKVFAMSAGMTSLCTVVFALIGWGSIIPLNQVGTLLFFGIACSMPCKGLVRQWCEKNGTGKTMHGKLIQGMLVGVCFVLALQQVSMH